MPTRDVDIVKKSTLPSTLCSIAVEGQQRESGRSAGASKLCLHLNGKQKKWQHVTAIMAQKETDERLRQGR